MVELFNTDRTIKFEPKAHTYTHNGNGERLTSVSRVLESVTLPFDREGVSMRMAKGDPARQAQILTEWDAKKDSSIDRGNWIHDALEQYALTGRIEEKLRPVAELIRPILKQCHRTFPEALLYSTHYGTAGQSDLVIQRQRSENSLFDFYDYKTNESKGIQFDGVNRKKDKPQHYNKFLLPPLDHMEDCNFNKYAMQLSTYAFMAQSTWGIKVGRLAILFIDNDLVLHKIAIPYLKLEAKALLEHHKSMKPLPQYVEGAVSSDADKDWDNDW